MHYYPELIRKHFLNPRNVGDVDGADGIGRAGSISCGAAVRISIRVDESQRIADAGFKAAGCSALVASASFLTEKVRNMTTGEAAAMARSPENVIATPRAIPADRLSCLALACEALLSAITQFSNAARGEWEGDEALICTCFCVSERTIEREIQRGGLQTIAEVTQACNAGAGCRSCYSLIQEMLEEHHREALTLTSAFEAR